jgi:hypothetical protein
MDITLFLSWAAFAVSVIGIPLTWYLARRGRQRPDLRSATYFDEIIKSDDGILDRLNMTFDQSKILSVSRSRVAFWNARGDTVLGSDVLPNDRLRLQLGADDIALNVRVVAMSREQIDVKGEIDPSDPTAAYITFDFIDASDGFIIELLHIKPDPARLEGTVRGAVIKREKADISSVAIDKAAAKWFLRLKHQPAKRLISLGGICLVSLVGATTMGWLFVDIASKVPRMVDISRFDLNQLEGQRDFATAVRDTGNTDPNSITRSLWFPAAYIAFILSAPAYFVINSLRAPIPRSIVGVRKSVTDIEVEGST